MAKRMTNTIGLSSLADGGCRGIVSCACAGHAHHRLHRVEDRRAQRRVAGAGARLRTLARRGQCGRRHQGRQPSATRSSSRATTTSRRSVRVQELYGRLITQDKAQFLFGPVSSGLNAMAAFVSEENGKVMLSTAVDPKIFRLGNRNLFQVTTPAIALFRRRARGAQGAQSQSARSRSSPRTIRSPAAVAQATRDLAKAEGLTVVLDEAYSPFARRLRLRSRQGSLVVEGRGACSAAGISPTARRWCARCASTKPASSG